MHGTATIMSEVSLLIINVPEPHSNREKRHGGHGEQTSTGNALALIRIEGPKIGIE